MHKKIGIIEMGVQYILSFLKEILKIFSSFYKIFLLIIIIVTLMRNNIQIFVVTIGSLILLIWLIYALKILFERLPPTFGKKGVYKYEKLRWVGFLSIGIIIGIVFSFFVFKPNRKYLTDAIFGTPTPTLTITPTLTPTPTHTLKPSETPTLYMHILVPSSTPSIIFKDNFLNKNNGWELTSNSSPNFTESTKIIGGKLEYTLSCPEKSDLLCQSWLIIPHVTAKNFIMKFETSVFSLYPSDSTVYTCLKFRALNNNEYYAIYLSNKGTVSLTLTKNGRTDYLKKDKFSSSIIKGLKETNIFEVIITETEFIIKGNGSEILSVEDANINASGNIAIGIFMPDYGNLATIWFDNLEIQEILSK